MEGAEPAQQPGGLQVRGGPSQGRSEGRQQQQRRIRGDQADDEEHGEGGGAATDRRLPDPAAGQTVPVPDIQGPEY